MWRLWLQGNEFGCEAVSLPQLGDPPEPKVWILRARGPPQIKPEHGVAVILGQQKAAIEGLPVEPFKLGEHLLFSGKSS